MKRYRAHYRSKAGNQTVTLLARNQAEAELLFAAELARRAARHDLTWQRINESDMTDEQRVREVERRKRDFSRYDVVTTRPDGTTEIGAAEAPLKLVKVEEVK